MNNIVEKFNRKVDELLKNRLSDKKIYKYLFLSYWHYLYYKNKKNKEPKKAQDGTLFMTSGMNYGAGIAHQLSCWYQGVALAKENSVGYAYPSFWINGGHAEPDDYIIKFQFGKFKVLKNSFAWDNILGFGENEKTIDELRKEGYKTRKLPYYNFSNPDNISEYRGIIDSYRGKKIILIPCVDQRTYLHSSEGKTDALRRKFWNSSHRQQDNICFSKDKTNIAVHIRRGDVSLNSYANRFLDFDYYINAINVVIKELNLKLEDVCIFIFSEGQPKDFSTFETYPNVRICLDWDSKKTFLHMVYADAIIAGASGFSVNAAAIGNGKRFVYEDSFTKYSKNLEWIMLNKKGEKVPDF